MPDSRPHLAWKGDLFRSSNKKNDHHLIEEGGVTKVVDEVTYQVPVDYEAHRGQMDSSAFPTAPGPDEGPDLDALVAFLLTQLQE